MDLHGKQKRLGLAPIASFEKSFENNTTTTTATAATTIATTDSTTTNTQQQQQQLPTQQAKRSSPHIFKFEDHQSFLQQHQRKDSASSEVAALLCISGRSSRISSIGSQGSAVSRLSTVSGVSRSPSPHLMLLETSFCGPKPVENVVAGTSASGGSTGISSGGVGSSSGYVADAPTTALLEQVLLSRKHDPTQVVLAEGINVECSSLRKVKPKMLSNGETNLNSGTMTSAAGVTASGELLKPGQMVVGKTPSGTEYIRINLKPDHMYTDKGIAVNERVVEAPNQLTPVYSKGHGITSKPATLSLRGHRDPDRLTPNASPKPSRHCILPKDTCGSRSPSPVAITVSRKSSLSSLFRLGGKDSPDSPRENSRSRSKSKDRQMAQSQNVTPNKQKSMFAIFKPGKRGSSAGTDGKSSKCSSPIEGYEQHLQQPTALSAKTNSRTPVINATGSRPKSRLRYYDEPVEGYIHIPLHTPPEERETRKLLEGIQQLNAEPVLPEAGAAITASQLVAASSALNPVGQRKASGDSELATVKTTAARLAAAAAAAATSRMKQQCAENLDAITALPQDTDDTKDRTSSLEVHRHSSQETVNSEGSFASAIRVTSGMRSSLLAHVKEQVSQDNGSANQDKAEIHQLPSIESTMSGGEPRIVDTVSAVDDIVARERRRLLFATRLGSGSQEQIFTTQFSISKTESQSSQLSEQVLESNNNHSEGTEGLHRQGTIIRRTEEDICSSNGSTSVAAAIPKRLGMGMDQMPTIVTSSTSNSTKSTTGIIVAQRQRSISSDNVKATVIIRYNQTSDEQSSRHESRSTSDEDTAETQCHSRYLENFDVRKKNHENVPCQPKRQGMTQEEIVTHVQPPPTQRSSRPTLPQPPPPTTTPSPSPPTTYGQQYRSGSGSGSPTPSDAPNSVYSGNGGREILLRSRSQSQAQVERRQTPTKPQRTTTLTTTTTLSCHTQGTPKADASETTPIQPKQSLVKSVTTPTASLTTTLMPTPVTKPSASSYGHESTIKSQIAVHMLSAFTISQADRQSTNSTDEPIESSESERDSDLASCRTVAIDPKRRHLPRHVGIIEDIESTGLVSHESFDDVLPNIPTTLPEERVQGIALIPMKERANMELKTCPVDRPRSTTPLNPSHIEEYCGNVMTPQEPNSGSSDQSSSSGMARCEKLRISLPRKDSTKDARRQGAKSPRRASNASGTKSWYEFAEEGLRATNLERKDSTITSQEGNDAAIVDDAPKTSGMTSTPKTATNTKAATSSSTQRKLSGHWIDFENIPEKRKPAKRITTLPKESSSAAATDGSHHHQHHHYPHLHHQQLPDVTATSTSTTMTNVTSGAGCADVEAEATLAGDSSRLRYNYVKPEDCQCECHEVERESSSATGASGTSGAGTATGTGNGSGDTKSAIIVDLLQQGEDMLPLIDPEQHDGIERSNSSRDYSCYTDDEIDLPPQRRSSTSRSKSGSFKLQEFPRRDATSPRNRKFPDNII